MKGMKSPLILLFTRDGDFAQSVREAVSMPETDGGEVAARIESDPTLRRIPVVFLTALVTKAEARSGLQIQGHPFLAKPISIPELVAGIERYLPAPSRDGHVAGFGVATCH
jgi:CheY-like chemotaxis protein